MLARARRLDPSSKTKMSVAIAFVMTLFIAVGWFGYQYVSSQNNQPTEAVPKSSEAVEIENLFNESVNRLKKEWENIKKYMQ